MNKYWISATLVIALGLIIGVTIFKVENVHNEKILLVESKLIIERAKDCINQKKCNNDIITLKELYENGFLERQVNRVTKEYYNEESYVTKKEDSYVFIDIT